MRGSRVGSLPRQSMDAEQLVDLATGEGLLRVAERCDHLA
jgi:hypothetical protein